MTKDSTFRVGIVGAGAISPYHLQALRRVKHARVVAVYDPDTERARQLAAAYQIPRVSETYEQLLNEVNVVHILTPPATHADLAVAALMANCDVFIEKPMATSPEDCERIAMAASLSQRTVGVDHSLLADPFTCRAKQLVDQGKIGRVLGMQFQRSQDAPEYAGGPLPSNGRHGGDSFRDLGIHALYQCELFLGPINAVNARFRRVGNDPLIYFDDWQAAIECQRGTAQLMLSWQTRPLRDVVYLFGTQGTIKLDRFGMNVTCVRAMRGPEHGQRAINTVWESVQSGFQVPLNLARVVLGRLRRYHGLQDMVGDFYQSLERGTKPRVDVESARRICNSLEQVAIEADRQCAAERASHLQKPLTAPVLVTGGTGFIGRHLVRQLLSEGRTLRLLCRTDAGELSRHPQVQIVTGDLGDPDVVDRAVAGTSVIYHVGGVVHGTAAEFSRGTVAGTRNIVDSALRHQVGQLIYVSSLSVLETPTEAPGVLHEASPLEPHPEQRGIYTQTKLTAEKYVRDAIANRGLPAVVVRPGEVVGAGAPLWSSGVGKRLGRHVVILGDGDLVVPLVNVRDVVAALRECERQKVVDGSILHLVDSRSLTQNELAAEFAVMSGQRLRVWHLPRAVIFLLAAVVEHTFELLGRQPPVTVYRFQSALGHRRFDVSRTQQRIAWRPVAGVLQGLKASVTSARSPVVQ